ncbi:MAG: PUA domain-containing protein, partial [Nitrososphaerales archaeon]
AFPYLFVDSGAVRFICNGADVMRPGVKAFPTAFNKGDIVVVKEEKFQKAIAVGEANISSQEAQLLTKGSVVSNLHYVGDKIWELAKEKGII